MVYAQIPSEKYETNGDFKNKNVVNFDQKQ